MLSFNLAQILEHHARARTRHPALVAGGVTITYGEFESQVRGYAAWLHGLGLAPGAIVGVALPDTPAHLVALYAVARQGCAILPMDCRWTQEEQSRVAQFFGAALALTANGAPALSGVKTIAGEYLPAPPGHGGPPIVGGDDTPFVLSLSSGTTGRPRGPLINHSHFKARFLTHWTSLTFNQHDRFLLATPLYFGGGRGFSMSYLFLGATVVFRPPPAAPEEIVETVNQAEISTLFLVPTMLRRLLTLPAPHGLLMPKLRVLISSGSILHAHERATIMSKLTPHCFEYYSSTEGGGISILTPAEQRLKPGSVGRPSFLVDVEIAGEDHQPMPRGEIGRIRYRGPAVAQGFHNDLDASRDAFRDGWYYPGDLGRMDEDGYLYIVGRVKDMIIRGGVNIYPAEIEHVLLEHDRVAEAAVVGWPSAERGEEVAGFVVASGADEAGLIAYCRQRMAPYKVPKRIFFLDELPKNTSGKVEKLKLVAQLPK
ncbi:MAG: long-chain fatty acid--CoA ligase [Alphaproteobacteria bacterium]|nr:long-chain fatty acid--CoA ligase [Alphaproteobacteria bacterium]